MHVLQLGRNWAPMVYRSTQHYFAADHHHTYIRVHHLRQDVTASTSSHTSPTTDDAQYGVHHSKKRTKLDSVSILQHQTKKTKPTCMHKQHWFSFNRRHPSHTQFTVYQSVVMLILLALAITASVTIVQKDCCRLLHIVVIVEQSHNRGGGGV